MRTLQWPVRAFIFVCLLQSLACTKTDTVLSDSVSLESSSSNAMAADDFSNCKLRYIYHEHLGVSDLMVWGLFTYYKGNPISLTYDYNGTGNPNHYFYYDTKQRLREWRQAYTPNDLVEAVWHKYGYNSNDEIIVDTMLRSGYRTEEGVIIFSDTVISTLTYDDQGRIIKEAIRSRGSTRNPTYTYDTRGNLGVIGWKSSSYDNKVSLFRSHPVFQFIFRNYSKNNAAPQARYNSKGLPLSLNPMNDAFFNASPTQDDGNVIDRIFYDCP